MNEIQSIYSSNFQGPLKSFDLFPLTLTPRRKKSSEQLSPYKNYLKKDTPQRVVGYQNFPNPSRIQKKRRKEKNKTNRKRTIRLLTKLKENDKDKVNKNEILFQEKVELIKKKILYKYKSPYMDYLYKHRYFFAAFVKKHKPTYYNFYQTNHILDKKKCSLFVKFKDYKIFLDNQEFFLKYFTKRESKIYLNYLLFFIYEKDPYIKSNKTYCLNKDRNHIKEDYSEIIINNIFGAQKIIYTKNLEKIPTFYNKNNNNIDQNLLDKKLMKKKSKISIPKYYLNIKPITSEINYFFVKDIPSIKIPHLMPNYFPNDLGLLYILKNIMLKNKYSVYVLNYKEYLFEKKPKKKESNNNNNNYFKKKDYSILNSYISSDSKSGEINTERNILNISKLYNLNHKHNIHSAFRRLKDDNDIADVETLAKNLRNNKANKDGIDSNLNDIENMENFDSEKDIFLSTLKKPFIGNRTKKENKKIIKFLKYKENKSLDKIKEYKSAGTIKNRIDITKSINEKIKFLKKKSEDIRKKHPLYVYLSDGKKKKKNMFNFFLNFYDLENNKKANLKINQDNKKMLYKYFPDRFLNPKKYREYLIKSPFLKTLQKIESTLSPINFLKNGNKIYNIKTIEPKKNLIIFNKDNAFSPNKKIYKFKETYKFLLGMRQKENTNYLRQNIFNKAQTFYQQFKTLNFATKNRSNFKKSGAFAFSSFSGSNYDKTENEWKDYADIELQNSYIHSFFASNLMKKIRSDYKKKKNNLKNFTTLKDIAKYPDIYT